MPNATKRQVEAWWYVLLSERDKPRDQQSRFLCNPLTQAQRMRVWDDHNWVTVDGGTGNRSITTRGLQQAHELCLDQIAKVENFPLDGPKPWPEKGSQREKEGYLEMLDDMDVFEIGDAIRNRSTLEPEVKNS